MNLIKGQLESERDSEQSTGKFLTLLTFDAILTSSSSTTFQFIYFLFFSFKTSEFT